MALWGQPVRAKGPRFGVHSLTIAIKRRGHCFTGHSQLPSQTRHSKTEETKSSQRQRERRLHRDRGNEEFAETEGTKNSQRQRERRLHRDRGNEEFTETEGTKSSQGQRERKIRVKEEFTETERTRSSQRR